jgi:hypothetical protein
MENVLSPIIFSAKLHFWFAYINAKIYNILYGSAWPVASVHLMVNITPVVTAITQKAVVSYNDWPKDRHVKAIKILKFWLKFSTSRFTKISGFSLTQKVVEMGERFILTTWRAYSEIST